MKPLCVRMYQGYCRLPDKQELSTLQPGSILSIIRISTTEKGVSSSCPYDVLPKIAKPRVSSPGDTVVFGQKVTFTPQ